MNIIDAHIEAVRIVRECIERTQPVRWWWLCFASDGVLLGVAIVQARGALTGVKRVNDLGINPGGAVCAFELPETHKVPRSVRNRLNSREDLYAAGYDVSRIV